MAGEHIDRVADVAVAASDQFTARHKDAVTSVGVISSKLRSMGIDADAVNIDCGHSGKRLVLIVMDQNPERVGIGIGQKETVGDYELIGQVETGDLEVAAVLDILEARFQLSES